MWPGATATAIWLTSVARMLASWGAEWRHISTRYEPSPCGNGAPSTATFSRIVRKR